MEPELESLSSSRLAYVPKSGILDSGPFYLCENGADGSRLGFSDSRWSLDFGCGLAGKSACSVLLQTYELTSVMTVLTVWTSNSVVVDGASVIVEYWRWC